MQVILKQNVQNLGKKGELKNVKEGYFMNFLMPKNLAEIATPAKIKAAEEMKKREVVQHERVKEHAGEIKAKIDGLKITMKAKAQGDKLYGAITEKAILDLIEEKINVRLEKKDLGLSEHIKVAGTYEIPVQLPGGLEAKLTLEVKGEK